MAESMDHPPEAHNNKRDIGNDVKGIRNAEEGSAVSEAMIRGWLFNGVEKAGDHDDNC